MKTTIHSIRFDASDRLHDHIEEKIEKLDMVYDKIISADVYLRLDKSSDASNKVAEVKINIPGKNLFARKKSSTFEDAVDAAIEALMKQLVRKKEKGTGG
ncbi:MAG: ribosome-associated translation inhibitor RaiA [Bacteroidetes bacterium]|nr:ribosome-associated translation inhibitor RaiA [Bacteroidota bacterium]